MIELHFGVQSLFSGNFKGKSRRISNEISSVSPFSIEDEFFYFYEIFFRVVFLLFISIFLFPFILFIFSEFPSAINSEKKKQILFLIQSQNNENKNLEKMTNKKK